MASLNFPVNPVNGQIYPPNPTVGQKVYRWDSAYTTWILLGVASGAAAGTYGSPTSIPRITLDVAGNVIDIQDVSPQLSTTTQAGVVKLTDNTLSNDPTSALTAAQGYYLQTQIGDLTQLDPPYPNLVEAINEAGGGGDPYYAPLDDLTSLFNGVATSFPLTLGGSPYTPNPQTNLMVFIGGVIQETGPGGSYTVTGNIITFTTPPPLGASFYATTVLDAGGGGGGAMVGTVTSVATGTGLSGGPILTSGTISLVPATTSTLGGVIPDGTTVTVSPTGVISATGSGSVGTLQQVTTAGNTTSNSIVVSAGGYTGTLASGSLTLSNPGGFVQPATTAIVSGSGITLSVSGGSSTMLLDSASGRATVASLVASGLIYPTADGTADQVLATNGTGDLQWLTTAKIVAVPASSASGGAAGQIAFGNGFFYWFDTATNQWLRVAGSTF